MLCREREEGNHTEQFVYKQDFKYETAMIVALLLVAEKKIMKSSSRCKNRKGAAMHGS